jgi:hypothetical protein
MIEFSGTAKSDRLFRLVDHHAQGIEDLIAPLAVVVLDTLGRTERLHRIHAREGWNSVNIRLDNGGKIALRARKAKGAYTRVLVFRGFNPLGEVVFEITKPADVVGKFRKSLLNWTG